MMVFMMITQHGISNTITDIGSSEIILVTCFLAGIQTGCRI